MKVPKISLHLERGIQKGKDFFAFFFELIPSVSFRYVRGGFGKEADLYLSWLLWTFSVVLSWRKTQ